VLEGFHPLKHALRFGAVVEIACAPDPKRLDALALDVAPDIGDALGRLVQQVSPDLFAKLAPAPPSTGVIAIARRPALDPEAMLSAAPNAPLVLLDSPSSLGNLGAVVRVAAAAAAAGVLTTGRHDPWHPAALRGSAGLHFALPVARIDALPPCGRTLLALDPEGEPLHPRAIPAGAILAFGSERRGLDRRILERAERRVALPMRAGVSSLNLATAVAVVLYAWRVGQSAADAAWPP
jgi:RNA methyltransferase, TrmH family